MALLVIGTRVCRGVSLRWPPIDVADDSPWITSELALGATLQSLLEVTTPCLAGVSELPHCRLHLLSGTSLSLGGYPDGIGSG